jgi:heptose-I-phosphate ethanolaminephosphotransferase
MFEVPFLLWKSPGLKIDVSRKTLQDRPYMLDDFIHSFSDLMKIDFEGYQPEKSIFNEQFSPKRRLIKEGELYEKEN